MLRRAFLASSSLAVSGALTGCGTRYPIAQTRGQQVPLSSVRRLRAECWDPMSGRCRYVATTDAGMFAQPILVARPGDVFDAVIDNALPQPTTVHFHGLMLAESQDGAGFDPIAPKAQRRLRFTVRNRAGLYWFHPHPHGATAEQVHAGLVGLLRVDDDEDAAVDSALGTIGANRLALALRDVRVRNEVWMPYSPTATECLHGWFGERVAVNDALDAAFAVDPGWVRLQLLNACNARGLLLAVRANSAPQPMVLLGTDSGLLAAPLELDRVFLHPGERVDVVFDARRLRDAEVVSLGFDPRHHISASDAPHAHSHPAHRSHAPLAAAGTCGATGITTVPPDGAPMPLFRLAVRGAARDGSVPKLLSSLAAPSAAELPARRVRLDLDPERGFVIDQVPYEPDAPGIAVARGAREIWEIRNSPISMPHPMHLHAFGMRVLRRQGTFGPARALATFGQGRIATDLGVKDTVTVWPNETVWVEVDFSLPADSAFAGPQRYMFHCHNLEHEDGMMMRNVTVA